MRVFAAVVPPPEEAEQLAEFLRPRQVSGTDLPVRLRWTLPQQWHITLAFMPDVADRCFDELHERMTRACAKRRPIPMSLGGAGAFPHVPVAKVVWAGVRITEDDREELRRLSVGCRSAAAKSGADVEGGRFHPHVTLARLGRPADVHRWVDVLDTYDGGQWVAQEVCLFASHLGQGVRGRPRYELIGRYPLGGDLRARARRQKVSVAQVLPFPSRIF
ncbi:MAG: RNA 2',3'-cyclic phosphodiesterase [Austwickia sp.]|jgi:2'-5' RNA ligase|nr:RNA 2',3'-cyclic phosphodiesterase [Austwickia sp.]MBK8437528.1 RNA 2',3'-cyclic phosphodiesterase [Austwickia sp.]MBK9102794.1 RNA 2',3'-cyclic phosphodiesterase [Austwickia sp.]